MTHESVWPSIWFSFSRLSVYLTKLIKHIICVQRFYRYLELKSKKPYAAVPPVDKTLKTITEPDPKLLAQNKSIIDEFKRRFELKQNPKVHS